MRASIALHTLRFPDDDRHVESREIRVIARAVWQILS